MRTVVPETLTAPLRAECRIVRAIVREALQTAPAGVEYIRMSRSYQHGEYGRSPQSGGRPAPQPPVALKRTLMCAKCGDPLDGHELLGDCLPAAYLGESPPLVVRNGRLVAV
jgi:hypothetical protein